MDTPTTTKMADRMQLAVDRFVEGTIELLDLQRYVALFGALVGRPVVAEVEVELANADDVLSLPGPGAPRIGKRPETGTPVWTFPAKQKWEED